MSLLLRARTRSWHLLKNAPLLPVIVLATVIIVSIFAPLLAPHDPLQTNMQHVLTPPVFIEGGSWEFPLGTDRVGRDTLSRIIYGGRISLFLAVTILSIGLVVGTLFGLLSGYMSGVVDAVIQRVVEMILSIPTLLAALVVLFVIGQTLVGVILVLVPFIAAKFTRMVRGEALSLRRSGYVESAQVAGASHLRIVFRHILPNLTGSIIVIGTLEVGQLILVEAGLGFLGVGVPPPLPAWGVMVADGRGYITSRWWLSMLPGLAILFTVLSFNWLGDWLRDYLDPKQRGR